MGPFCGGRHTGCIASLTTTSDGTVVKRSKNLHSHPETRGKCHALVLQQNMSKRTRDELYPRSTRMNGIFCRCGTTSVLTCPEPTTTVRDTTVVLVSVL